MTLRTQANTVRYSAFVVMLAALAMASGFRTWVAHDDAVQAQGQLETLIADAASIIHLRGQEERIAWRAKPEGDLLAHVNAVLAEAGVSSAKLGGVMGEAVTSTEGTNGRSPGTNRTLRKQTMRVSLNEMSPMDLGMFLTAWRSHKSLWSIDQMELQHARATQDMDMYDAWIVVAAWFHEHDGSQGQ